MIYFQLALLSFSSLAIAHPGLNGNNLNGVKNSAGNVKIVGNGIGNVTSDVNIAGGGQVSGTVVNRINENSNGSGCQQICGSSGNTWQANNKCYCGDEGKKVSQCVFKASPDWPLLPAKLGKDTQCPSPVTDSAGFSACIQGKIKQADPNAQSIVNSCVSSTGAKSSGSV